jgi:hypothetical protein
MHISDFIAQFNHLTFLYGVKLSSVSTFTEKAKTGAKMSELEQFPIETAGDILNGKYNIWTFLYQHPSNKIFTVADIIYNTNNNKIRTSWQNILDKREVSFYLWKKYAYLEHKEYGIFEFDRPNTQTGREEFIKWLTV